MHHIAFITLNYPSAQTPSNGTFVRQLVHGMARLGVRCSVICPVSVFDILRGGSPPFSETDEEVKGNPIKIVRPRYVSFSNKQIFRYNSARATLASFHSAARRGLSSLDSTPGCFYGHFLYDAGCTAVRLASKLGAKSFVGVGESSFWSVDPIGIERAVRDFSRANGFVAVSTAIRKNLKSKLRIPEEKIAVLPNGVNPGIFYPRNRLAMREKYGFPRDQFIISFVGHFDERKGPHRVLGAVAGMKDVGLIFIGKGDMPLRGDNILFSGLVDHAKIPEMLSASDVFVLPTLAEGCCNALIEALACGLPLVTSDGEFNDDIATDETSIRVDPRSEGEIRAAILKLLEGRDKRLLMARKAAERAKAFNIDARAAKMFEWMQSR